jgi:hypothetical protein
MGVKVHLLSFASSRVGSLHRLRRETEGMGCFASITLLSSSDLGADYWSVCGDFVRTHSGRGYGFWSWKLYIIHRHLSTLPEGDVLLYVDAGFSLNVEGLSRLNYYVSRTISHASGWFVFETNHSIGAYTKRSLLRAHGADNETMRAQPMILSGCQFIVVRPDNVALAKQWYEAMQIRGLIDDSPAPYGFLSKSPADSSANAIFRRLSLLARTLRWLHSVADAHQRLSHHKERGQAPRRRARFPCWCR